MARFIRNADRWVIYFAGFIDFVILGNFSYLPYDCPHLFNNNDDMENNSSAFPMEEHPLYLALFVIFSLLRKKGKRPMKIYQIGDRDPLFVVFCLPWFL